MTSPHKTNKYSYLADPSKSVINYQYKAQPGYLYLKTNEKVNDQIYQPNYDNRELNKKTIQANQQYSEELHLNYKRFEKTPPKKINYEYKMLSSNQDYLTNKIYQHNFQQQSYKKHNYQYKSKEKEDDPFRIIKNSHIKDLEEINQWSSYQNKNLKNNPPFIPKTQNLVESRTLSKSPQQKYKVLKKQESNSRVQMNAIYLPICHQHQKQLLFAQHSKKNSYHNLSKQNLSEDVTFRNQMGGFKLNINSDKKKKVDNTPYRYLNVQCQNNPQVYFPRKIEDEIHYHKKSHSAYIKISPRKYPIQFPFQ